MNIFDSIDIPNFRADLFIPYGEVLMPIVKYIVTESGDTIVTEDGDKIKTEESV